MEIQEIPKELELFYLNLPTDPLYILREHFITVHTIRQKPCHQVPLNFIMVFKRVNLDL